MGFPKEAFELVGVIGKRPGHHLDGNESIEVRVGALVDDTHPATTDNVDDIVLSDLCWSVSGHSWNVVPDEGTEARAGRLGSSCLQLSAAEPHELTSPHAPRASRQDAKPAAVPTPSSHGFRLLCYELLMAATKAAHEESAKYPFAGSRAKWKAGSVPDEPTRPILVLACLPVFRRAVAWLRERTMNLALHVAGKTDIGSVRSNNEDNFGYDTRRGIFLVCDGMGGQAAGERASKIAVDTVLGYFRQNPKSRDRGVIGRRYDGVSERANSLAQAIHLANQAIHEEAEQHIEQTGMGSTIVAVATEGQYFSIANVGDSRIYLLRCGTIQQLTNDHSLVMEQVRRGLMTIEEAEKSEMQSILVRSLGVEDTVDPDLADLEFAAGDVVLLCSDGLSRFVAPDAILATVKNTELLKNACSALIENAKAAGSDDNVTCLLLRATEQSRVERMLDRLLPGRNRHKWQDSAR